ncbi:MAG: hypothetical protein CVT93_06975 [Bacteroidetes bacterium HGW-Bacteroidetes-10]|nr:MAG: hypothetical protein CVT93_06975 [Bacteroidetes bacterium HGW-Bacteroidetes-10]
MKALTFVMMLIISTQFVVAQNKGEQIIHVPLKDSVIFIEGVMNANPALTGELILNTIRYSALSSEYYLSVQGIIYLQVKQGKIKYTITDFYYKLEDISKTFTFHSEGDSKTLLSKATSDQLGKVIRKEYTHYLNEIDNKIKIKLHSLKEFVNRPIFDEF